MTTSRNLVPWIGTVLLVSVTALAVLGILRAGQAHPPVSLAGRAVLGLCALTGLAGLVAVWVPRLRRAR